MKTFENAKKIEKLMNKIVIGKSSENNSFGSRFAPNIIFYDKKNNFIDKVDTLHYVNARTKKGLFKNKILLECKTQIFHGGFVSHVLKNNSFTGKIIIESIIRNLWGKDYSLNIYADKVKMKDYKVECDGNDKIYYLVFTLEINLTKKFDYEIAKYVDE